MCGLESSKTTRVTTNALLDDLCPLSRFRDPDRTRIEFFEPRCPATVARGNGPVRNYHTIRLLRYYDPVYNRRLFDAVDTASGRGLGEIGRGYLEIDFDRCGLQVKLPGQSSTGEYVIGNYTGSAVSLMSARYNPSISLSSSYDDSRRA